MPGGTRERHCEYAEYGMDHVGGEKWDNNERRIGGVVGFGIVGIRGRRFWLM